MNLNDRPLDELLKEYIEEHRELFKDVTYLAFRRIIKRIYRRTQRII